MNRSLGARIAFGVALVVVALLAANYVATHDLDRTLRQFTAGRPVTWPPRPEDRSTPPVEAVPYAKTIAFIVAGLAGFGSIAGVGILRSRCRHRRLRAETTIRHELRLGRDDTSDPYSVRKDLDGILGGIRVRWHRRLLWGQPHLALEIHRLAGGTIKFFIAAPQATWPAIKGGLQNLYPDVELLPVPDRPEYADHIVRLKKARSFELPLQTTKDYNHSFAESLVSTLDALTQPVAVQIVLTPAPARMEKRSRNRLQDHERDLNAQDDRDPLSPGMDSHLASKELKGSLDTQHSSLTYCDIRISGRDAEEVRTVAGAFSELQAENKLVQREMRLRRGLYAGRITAASPNPIPSFRVGLLSAHELASLWQLPSGRTQHARIPRSTVRRALASPEVARDLQQALVRDERGPISMLPQDRRFGHAIMGGQGVGKSSVLARHVVNDVNDPGRAVILLDPKGDLADICLSAVPTSRTVHYLDLGTPEFSINPLRMSASPGARADMFVRALIEANPDGAIQAASDSFLRQAAFAICAVEAKPSFWHIYRLLEPAPESAYRQSVLQRLDQIPTAAFARQYWRREFPRLIADKGFAAQALNPPRNKIERLISTNEIDVLLGHPVTIDLQGIIDRREVLIVGGAKATVGEDNAILVMLLILQLVHQVVQAQQQLPRSERFPIALNIDEAHNILTPSITKMIAEGRSAGLEPAFAWQYSAQIKDDVVRSGLRSLLQSISIHRMRELEDARSLVGLAMEVYSDRIGIDPEEQGRLRFSVDDILRLPVGDGYHSFLVDGTPRPAFKAQSLRMEDLHDPAVAEIHRERQHQRGCHTLDYLPHPLAADPPPPKTSTDSPDDTAKSSGANTRRRRPRSPAAAAADADALGLRQLDLDSLE